MSAAKILLMYLMVLMQILSIFLVQTSPSAVCFTPDGNKGKCLLVSQCKTVTSIMLNETTTTMFDALWCGFKAGRRITIDRLKVCCASSETTLVRSMPSTSTVIKNHPKLGLLPTDCGVAKVDDRILGGNRTMLFEFPWMALLSYSKDSGQKFGCGGTIINQRYILTAAHCVKNLGRYKLVSVRVGEHDINNEVDCDPNNPEICAPPYQDIGIQEAIPHPEYSAKRIPGRGPTFQNDIALIRLSKSINMTQKNAKAVCLPVSENSRHKTFENQSFVVAGWGITDGGISSPVLLKVAVPHSPNNECDHKLKGSIGENITFRQICGGGIEGRDACNGDSGGPLMQLVLEGRAIYVQFGVVSFGPRDCGKGNIPGVYTRVTHYLKWILDTIRK